MGIGVGSHIIKTKQGLHPRGTKQYKEDDVTLIITGTIFADIAPLIKTSRWFKGVTPAPLVVSDEFLPKMYPAPYILRSLDEMIEGGERFLYDEDLIYTEPITDTVWAVDVETLWRLQYTERAGYLVMPPEMALQCVESSAISYDILLIPDNPAYKDAFYADSELWMSDLQKVYKNQAAAFAKL